MKENKEIQIIKKALQRIEIELDKYTMITSRITSMR